MMNTGLQSHMGGVEICMYNKKFSAKDTVPITTHVGYGSVSLSEVRSAEITPEL